MYVLILSKDFPVHVPIHWLTCLKDLEREDFPLNSSSAAFFSRVISLVGHNPASVVQMRAYVRETEALDRDINRRRQGLRGQYRAREAQLLQENQAQLEADERELDIESDARQRRLDIGFESSLDPIRQPEHDSDHHMPREAVGTMNRDPQSQFRVPEFALPTLDSDPRSHPGPGSIGDLHHIFLPVQRSAVNAYEMEDEAFHDVSARQTSPPTAPRESHTSSVPGNVLPTHASESLEAVHAIALAVDDARNESDSLFELSPNSGHGSSCGCGKVCPKGQVSCDSCADVFDNGPDFS
jgi:hypothetical protein